MKAVAIYEFGEPEVLKLIEMEKPEPEADEVLIKVAGAGVNPVDAKTRKGLGFVAESIKDSLPWVPGFDVAGVVEKAGNEVKEFKVGDRVYGRLNFQTATGGYTEYTVAKETDIAKAPENIELLYAAGVPVAGMTAWQGLFRVGSVKEGDRVLIHAGAGGVGHFAVQFAKMAGAYVICTASEINRSLLIEHGADEVIDYNKLAFEKVIEPVDFILDNMGFDVAERSLEILKKDGLMVTVPTIAAEKAKEAGAKKGLKVEGIKVQISKENLTNIAEMIDSGAVRVFVSQIYSLAEAVQAHRDIESGSTRGKIVLGVS